MTINNTGATRIVFVFRTKVVKVPRVTSSWRSFLRGLLANIDERRTWVYSGSDPQQKVLRDELLAPVLWASWGGWILVMQRADVERHFQEVYEAADIGPIDPEEEIAIRYRRWIEAGYGGDDKSDAYGYIGDRLVKIDYAQ